MLAINMYVGVFLDDSKSANGLVSRWLIFLFAWYFSAGRAQGIYVKEKFGSTYAKKPWVKALLFGVAAFFGYYIAAVVVSFAFGVIK